MFWFGVFVILCGFIVSGLVVHLYYRSKTIRREAGQLLMAPVRLWFGNPRRSRSWDYFSRVMFIVFILQQGLPFGITGILFAATIVLSFLPMVFWYSSPRGAARLELRANGIVISGTGLTLWTAIKRYKWKGTGPVDQLKLYLPTMITDLPISDDDRDDVESVFATRLAQREALASL